MSERPLVVVAMSGGVDSSVAAGLLVESGYQVAGMMLRLWNETGVEEKNRCCTPDAVAQARRVAAILDIPFYVVDAKMLFRETVVESFLDGYRKGETPNPCVLCNRVIRWGFLLEQAQKIRAQYLATGHYARIVSDESGRMRLLKGVDDRKDQSYVLSRLNQVQLSQTMLPLGGLKKTEVREHARSLKLPVAERADSQDLCFIDEGDYRPFLLRHVPETACPGKIVTRQGEVLGMHQGLAFYTIGQRKGLKIASSNPLYVIEKNLKDNVLVVGSENELGRSTFRVNDVHWIAGEPPGKIIRAEVKIRYKANLVPVAIRPEVGRKAQVDSEQPLRDVTPGQLAVFYDGESVLGSGFIEWRDET